MKKFRGAFTALVTPMEADGNIDFAGLRSLVKMQLNAGIDGLVPLGTTAETPTLDETEEDKIIDAVFSEVRDFEKNPARRFRLFSGREAIIRKMRYVIRNAQKKPVPMPL